MQFLKDGVQTVDALKSKWADCHARQILKLVGMNFHLERGQGVPALNALLGLLLLL